MINNKTSFKIDPIRVMKKKQEVLTILTGFKVIIIDRRTDKYDLQNCFATIESCFCIITATVIILYCSLQYTMEINYNNKNEHFLFILRKTEQFLFVEYY